MPRIVFVEASGTHHEVSVEEGLTLMEAAVSNNVPGIDADCGGACACATCHVFIDGTWAAQLSAQSEMEVSMLDFAEHVRDTSRLACQITLTKDHDGMVVTLPDAQH